MFVMPIEYIPARRSPAVTKANQTKRERWQRLVNDPAAWTAMLSYWDLWEGVTRGGHLHADELTGLLWAFAQRFGVKWGYVTRFRAHTHARWLAARQKDAGAVDIAFTDADRAALAAWLG
jgi:hypothetical protein